MRKKVEKELVYLTKKIKNYLHNKTNEYQTYYMYDKENELDNMFEDNPKQEECQIDQQEDRERHAHRRQHRMIDRIQSVTKPY